MSSTFAPSPLDLNTTVEELNRSLHLRRQLIEATFKEANVDKPYARLYASWLSSRVPGARPVYGETFLSFSFDPEAVTDYDDLSLLMSMIQNAQSMEEVKFYFKGFSSDTMYMFYENYANTILMWHKPGYRTLGLGEAIRLTGELPAILTTVASL